MANDKGDARDDVEKQLRTQTVRHRGLPAQLDSSIPSPPTYTHTHTKPRVPGSRHASPTQLGLQTPPTQHRGPKDAGIRAEPGKLLAAPSLMPSTRPNCAIKSIVTSSQYNPTLKRRLSAILPKSPQIGICPLHTHPLPLRNKGGGSEVGPPRQSWECVTR
jgi:hypothetical protein